MDRPRLCSRTLLRTALLVYLLAFVGIIIAANHGGGKVIWSFVGSIPLGDKIGHVVLVGTLTILLNAVLGQRAAPKRLHFMMLGSLIVLIGMTTEEFSQFFNANRSCDPLDWLANLIGIFVGELILRRISCRHRPRKA